MKAAIRGGMDFLMRKIAYDGKFDFFKNIKNMRENAGEDITALLKKLKFIDDKTINVIITTLGEQFENKDGP